LFLKREEMIDRLRKSHRQERHKQSAKRRRRISRFTSANLMILPVKAAKR